MQLALEAEMGKTVISSHRGWPIIKVELGDVLRAGKIPDKRRRWLLQVLHSTRALDSALAAFVQQKGIRPTKKRGKLTGLGSYLKLLEAHGTSRGGRLPRGFARKYQMSIVNHRNRFMHEAGSFPANEAEIRTLLGEMQSCMAAVALL
jgi:hypothetical protein